MALEYNIDGKQAIAELNRLSAGYDQLTKSLGLTILEAQKQDKRVASLTASHKQLTAQVTTLSKEVEVLTTQQKKQEAVTSSLSSSLSKIAANTKAYRIELEKQSAAITKTYNQTTSLASANFAHQKATKQATLATLSQDAATGKLNAEFAKSISLEADLLLLRNQGYKTLLAENAAKERALGTNAKYNAAQARTKILLGATRAEFVKLYDAENRHGKMLRLMRAEQIKYNAAALQGISAAQKLIGVELAGSKQNSLIAGQMERRAKARAAANAQLRKTYIEAQKLYSVEKKLIASSSTLAGANKRLTNSQTALGSAFRGTAGALGGLWLAYGQILPMMAAFAAATTAKDIIQKGAAYEYLTTFIFAIGDAAGEAAERSAELRDELLQMEGLRKGPLELAAGMREFAKAGIEAEVGLKNIAEMSRFATLAELDLSAATSLIIGQANAFGETYSDAANKIAGAAFSSATSITEMAQAMAQTTELGSVSKMSFEETAGALAVMANAGIRGSRAGTALRTSIMRLQTPTSKLNKMLTALGISFSAFASDGSARGLIEMFKELDIKLDDLADVDRTKVIREMFGLRAMKGGAILIKKANAGLGEMVEKVDQAAEGVTSLQRAIDSLEDTTVARWEKLLVLWEKMVVNVKSGPVAKFLIDVAAGIVTAFSTVLSPIDAATAAFNHWQEIGLIPELSSEAQQKALEDFANKYNQIVTAIDSNKDAEGIKEWAANVREALGEVGVALEELDTRTPDQIVAMEQFRAKTIHDAMVQVWNDEQEMAKKRDKLAEGRLTTLKAREKSKGDEIHKAMVAVYNDEKNMAKKKIALAEKAAKEYKALAKDRADASRELKLILNDNAQGNYNYEKSLLKDKYDDLKTLLGDSSELRKAHEIELDTLNDERILKTGTFFEGVSLGYKKMLEDQTTWAESGLDIFNTFYEGIQDSFSSNIVDVMKGNFDDLGDAWESLLDTMLKAFADMIAEMIARWFASGIMGMIEGRGYSGFSLGGSGGGVIGAAGTAKEGYDAYQTGTGIVGAAKAGYEGYQAYGTISAGLGKAIPAYEAYTMAQGAATASEAISASMAAQGAAEVGMMSSTGSMSGLSGGSTVGGGGMAAGSLVAAGPILAILAAAYIGLRGSTPMDLGDLIGTEGGPGDIQRTFGTSYLSAPSQDLGYTGEHTQLFMGLLDGVETASLDAAEGILVLQRREREYTAAAEDNNEAIGEAAYRMVLYNEETQKWVDQTPQFEAMFETMQSIGPVTDAAVLSTAAMVAEMGGIPSVADELVAAYNEVAGTTAIAANSLEASLQQYISSMYGVTVSNERATIATQHLSQVKAGDEGATAALTASLIRMGLSTAEAAQATRELTNGSAQLQNSLTGAAAATQALSHGSAAASEEASQLGGIVMDMGRAFISAGNSAAGAMSKISSTSGAVRSPVSANAHGGMIPGPITGIDNIYAGNVNGVDQLVTGGEYIVNPYSTAKHKRELDAINADRYATGGQAPGALSAVMEAPNVSVRIFLSGRELKGEIDKVIVEREDQGPTGAVYI